MAWEGCSLDLVLDSPGPFKWGDLVKGKVVFTNQEQRDLYNIDVMLRCTETVCLFIGKAAINRWHTQNLTHFHRLYSYRQTLFPLHLQKSGREPPISWNSQQHKPSSKWRSEYTSKFSLEQGSHEFGFEFIVPEHFPSSLFVTAKKKLQWQVVAKVFVAGDNTSHDEAKTIKIFKAETVKYVPSRTQRLSTVSDITVYFSGYRQHQRTFCGLLNRLRKQKSRFEHTLDLVFYAEVPRVGIIQRPYPCNVSVGVGSHVPCTVLLREFRLKLRRIVHMEIRDVGITYSDRNRRTITLYRREDINKPLKPALDSLNYDIRQVRVGGFLTDNFTSDGLDVSFRLVAVFVLASEENPKLLQKVRLSQPVRVRSCMAEIIEGTDLGDKSPDGPDMDEYSFADY